MSNFVFYFSVPFTYTTIITHEKMSIFEGIFMYIIIPNSRRGGGRFAILKEKTFSEIERTHLQTYLSPFLPFGIPTHYLTTSPSFLPTSPLSNHHKPQVNQRFKPSKPISSPSYPLNLSSLTLSPSSP